ncbi:MAG: type II secretion system F family protein, partial [Holophagales bacterium]|nr:type II secretion system F family protein [Holophagales bacterium]
ISDAFAVHKDRLPIAYVSTLVAGERSGDLADAVGRYVSYARLTNKLQKNFKKALYYPAFLILLSSGMIALMLLYVLPEFSKFYEGFEESLPGFTLFVLNLADVLRFYWPVILGGAVAAFFALRWWRRTDSGGRALARLKFSLPLIGDLTHKYQLSQIFHSLSVMLRGGMPLLTCLEDMRASVANPLLTDALGLSRQRVSEGESLSAAIEDTPLETDLSGEMIQVGESTGSLPEMLTNVAEFYDEEVQNRTEALLSLVEPMLLLLMAIIIGSLLFAMYYPLFRLMGSLGAGA